MSYDVAVVGGGPAGAIAAYVLARAGRRVLLVDDSSADTQRVGESLPPIAGHLLGQLDLRAVLDHQAVAYGNLSSWGTNELESTDFIHDPHGTGWHLDRSRFDRDLRAAAVVAGATLRPERLREATRGPEGWSLRFAESTDAETAACVIDATGRRATIARREGAKRTRDDDLIALYAWTRPEPEGPAQPKASLGPPRLERGVGCRGEALTMVEATADGWWYTAPLPGGAHVVVLHADEEQARAVRDDPARWHALLGATRHVSERLAGLAFDALPRATEACGARLDAFVGRGWVATGDAALSFDPIAAQGLFNALYTGMKAGQAVAAALQGDPKELSAYTSRLEEIRAAYAERHVYVYRLEARFAESPFWRARREMAPRAGDG